MGEAGYSAVLARRWDAGGGLVGVAFEAPVAVLATYKRPGQYVAIFEAEAPSYFVLACAVGALEVEILFRPADDVTNALATAPIGRVFRISEAQGAGFPCDDARGRPLVVAVAGTGIAGARSVVAWRVVDGDAAKTAVYIGVRRLADLALETEIAGWTRAGIAVTIAVSREDPASASARVSATAIRGYVQDAIGCGPRLAAGAMLFAIGPDAMIAALRSLSAALGVGERDLHTND